MPRLRPRMSLATSLPCDRTRTKPCAACAGAGDAAALHGRHVSGSRRRHPRLARRHALDIRRGAFEEETPAGPARPPAEGSDGPDPRRAWHYWVYHHCRRSLTPYRIRIWLLLLETERCPTELSAPVYMDKLGNSLELPARLLALRGRLLPPRPRLRLPLLPPRVQQHGLLTVLLQPCVHQGRRQALLVNPAVQLSVRPPADDNVHLKRIIVLHPSLHHTPISSIVG